MPSNTKEVLIAFGRLLMSLIFIYAGFSKIFAYHQTSVYMEMHGITTILQPVVIALEILGGFALAIGLFTRLVAAVLSIYSVAAIVIFLVPPANQFGIILMLAEISFVGGLIDFSVRGGGQVSIDHYLLSGKSLSAIPQTTTVSKDI